MDAVVRRVEAGRQLVEDDVPLHLDVIAVERGVHDDIGQEVDGHRQLAGGDPGVEGRGLPPGEGVHVAADPVDGLGDLQSRPVGRALEEEMLQEVRRPGEGVGFVAGTYLRPHADGDRRRVGQVLGDDPEAVSEGARLDQRRESRPRPPRSRPPPRPPRSRPPPPAPAGAAGPRSPNSDCSSCSNSSSKETFTGRSSPLSLPGASSSRLGRRSLSRSRSRSRDSPRSRSRSPPRSRSPRSIAAVPGLAAVAGLTRGRSLVVVAATVLTQRGQADTLPSGSMSSTRTWMASPSETTSSTRSMRRLPPSLEMWTRPSRPGRMLTKAPNLVMLTTLPS